MKKLSVLLVAISILLSSLCLLGATDKNFMPDKLWHALIEGNLEKVKGFDADINKKHKYTGGGALHGAAGSNRADLPLIKYLVEEKKLDINAKDKKGNTPILELVDRMIVAFGKTKEAKKAKQIRNILDIAKYLISKGADISAVDEHGAGVLEGAVNQGIEVVKFFVDKGANVNQLKTLKIEGKIWDQSTPFSQACMGGELDIVKYMVQKGKSKISPESIRLAKKSIAEILKVIDYGKKKIEEQERNIQQVAKIVNSLKVKAKK